MTASVVEDLQEDRVVQLVTFRLSGETYGIDVMQVQEVLRVSEIAPVPGAPGYVLGIINLRGNVVTIIDTRARFGLPPGETDDAARIVIIESDQQIVGMLVDSVAEVVDLRESQMDAAPGVGNEDNPSHIRGVATLGDELLILVDLNWLLTHQPWSEAGSR